MLRILHISDLHFCSETVASQLESFRGSLTSLLPVDLEIHQAVPEVASALSNLIQELNPDALVISGDITALGDVGSFDFAWKWLAPLIVRGGGENRSCIVVPGNHDVLLAQLARLSLNRSRLPWLTEKLLRLWLRKPMAALQYLVASGLPGDRQDVFANFGSFISRSPSVTDKMLALKLEEESRVVLHSFCSVSVDPIWMNLGSVRAQEVERLAAALRNHDSHGEGKLRILVLHHNPVSSSHKVEPPLTNAYNSMPAGPQFLRTLQQSGVDLILHGHQHEDACLLFDFDLDSSGHAFALGCGSSTSKTGGTCNLINLDDINHATIRRYSFEPAFGSFRALPEVPLLFERH